MVFHQALFIFVPAAGDAEKSSEAFSIIIRCIVQIFRLTPRYPTRGKAMIQRPFSDSFVPKNKSQELGRFELQNGVFE